jgi:hypothetical protein
MTESLTREQISVRAIEIANMCANGSYKNAVACIGRMVVLAEEIHDDYWGMTREYRCRCGKEKTK